MRCEMGREQERIKRRIEKNPLKEYTKIQHKFYPELFTKFDKVKDPRNQSYIEYSNRVMLGTLYFKAVGVVPSMQQMTKLFNNDYAVKNIYKQLDSDRKEYLPHYVTINEYLERLKPEELEKIQKDIVYKLIRRKTFDSAKVCKKWLVIVDGTELDEGTEQKNNNYLQRCYNRGTQEEYTRYHRSVLEAKIYFGNNLVASIATETIENDTDYEIKRKVMKV
jgi:hypothetical protein